MNAIALAEELFEFHPLFYEDPIQIDSIKSQSEIAKKISIPIANGERMHTIWEFREMFEIGGSQYARPDVGLAGGITHVKKISSIAESYHSSVVTHNYLGPVITAASCNIDTSIPNFITQEFSTIDESPINQIFKTDWVRKNGFIEVPDCVGIGIEVNFDELKKQKFKTRLQKNIPMRKDGSVGYSV